MKCDLSINDRKNINKRPSLFSQTEKRVARLSARLKPLNVFSCKNNCFKIAVNFPDFNKYHIIDITEHKTMMPYY